MLFADFMDSLSRLSSLDRKKKVFGAIQKLLSESVCRLKVCMIRKKNRINCTDQVEVFEDFLSKVSQRSNSLLYDDSDGEVLVNINPHLECLLERKINPGLAERLGNLILLITYAESQGLIRLSPLAGSSGPSLRNPDNVGGKASHRKRHIGSAY